MACVSAVSVTVTACVVPVAAQVSGTKSTSLALASSSPSKSFASKLNVTSKSRVTMRFVFLSLKEQNIAGLTGLALLAAAVVPEIAEAAQPGVSASLKNLLFSVVAGGVVLVAIGGAVAGVSTFDPVKRR
ncbi:unnamed protein product [Sphagnum troendelagicum]|uniref:Ultraviolet-B-repressible protein n=1 Tax=Sphagnum troendelagicum TaxID=128251 RepID=A0ABP0U8W6_9BRYO